MDHSTAQQLGRAKAIFEAAVRSVQPEELLTNFDYEDAAGRSLASFERIWVVGAGKAAMAMAGSTERRLEGYTLAGQVTVPTGYCATLPALQPRPNVIQVTEGEHPYPGESSVDAAEDALEIARQCEEQDLMLVLISGGASALWCLPGPGISLDNIRRVNELLLQSGASIHRINEVRTQLSQIKGGKLARAGFPATTLALVISDVPGDDLSIIGSGPTVKCETLRWDAADTLHKLRLWYRVPPIVRDHLWHGHEVPPVRQPWDRVKNFMIGNNATALAGAGRAAESFGYDVKTRENVTGEARLVGREMALHLVNQPPGVCLLWGGETTVTVTGSGIGGRNHEAALAAAEVLGGSGKNAVLLSGGTDGIDGPTGAAGAWATSATVRNLRGKGLDANRALENNDSYTALAAVGSSFSTGPTHTNVMDVMVGLVF